MDDKENHFAYIDAANLHKGIHSLGWELNYARFRVWLKEKYHIEKAYLFIGLVPKNKKLYEHLQEAGFILRYKEVTYDGAGAIKGNCDAGLVLKAMIDFYENNLKQAILVSSDGDYAELVSFFKKRNALKIIVSPSNKCSFLLRKLNVPIIYLDNQKSKLAKKPSIGTKPYKGLFHGDE